MVRDYLLKTNNQVPEKSVHPSQALNQPEIEDEKPGSAGSKVSEMSVPLRGNTPKAKKNLAKVLSQKAIKIGKETGVTAEFVVQQTGEQLVYKLDDLFAMFDTFQESLYSNDPAANVHEVRSQKQANEPATAGGENKVMYEESILMTLLGPDYMQYISEETGEWVNEEAVIEKFRELFEKRIREIFDA